MSRGLKRFFAICAIAVGAGLIMSIIGFAAGGIKSIDKMAERYDWLHGGPGNMLYMDLEGGAEFNSVDVEGDLDVIFYSGASGTTRIAYGENETVPEMYVENGVLKVKATYDYDGGVINLSGIDSTPTLEVYCGEDNALTDIKANLNCGDIDIRDITVNNIDIDTDLGDVAFNGTAFDNASIKTDAGDIDGTDMISRGLYIENDLGDCEISGEFTGTTEIISDSGDVDISTSLSETQYTVTADVSAGELSVGEKDFDSLDQHYSNGTEIQGAHIIKVSADIGDVDIQFDRHYSEHHND